MMNFLNKKSIGIEHYLSHFPPLIAVYTPFEY